MNDDDFRDVCAMLSMVGLIIRGGDLDINQAWDIADKMLEGRNAEPEPEEGIVAIKKRIRRKT
jgi:hypothetical protein